MLNKENFNAQVNLLGGQSFLWRKIDDGYLCFSNKTPGVLREQGGEFLWSGAPSAEAYFGDSREYEASIERLKKDKVLREALKEIQGVRVLKQDLEELIFTFIISSNNNLKRIRSTVHCITENFGKFDARIDANIYPSAETIASLSEKDLQKCGVGYRAKSLIESAKIFLRKWGNFESLQEEELSEALKILPGVGDKVADCIAVFSGRACNFSPMDVWAKRILREYYEVEFKKYSDYRDWWSEHFGKDAALAGQVLFEGIRGK